MAAVSFKHLLECLQGPESLPHDTMTGYEALRFGDIHFTTPQYTLNLQQVSLTYLKSLVADNSFQPEGIKPDTYSGTTTILIVFLSEEDHEGTEHVHIGLVVCNGGCCLYTQEGILPFVKAIEADLKKVRDRHTQNKDPGCACSYSLPLANYGVIMAIPTNPPYCLVYPTVYNDDTEDQNHFNMAGRPSGMHTCSCICCTLLQDTDKDPAHQRAYEGSHLIIPCGAQYRTLFPEIVTPHNHQGPLNNHNTGEPYPMEVVGEFCLMDPIFPGSPGDSYLFKEGDLESLKRKGFHISTYREEKPTPTVPKEDKQKSSCIKDSVPAHF